MVVFPLLSLQNHPKKVPAPKTDKPMCPKLGDILCPAQPKWRVSSDVLSSKNQLGEPVESSMRPTPEVSTGWLVTVSRVWVARVAWAFLEVAAS